MKLRTLITTGVSRSIVALGGLAFTAAVGRLFGAEMLGLFVYANSLALLLVMLARFGGDRDLIKFVSINRQAGRAADRLARLRTACFVSILLAGLAVAGLTFVPLLGDPPSRRLETLAMLAPAIPFLTWMWLNAGFLKGLSYPQLGTLFENGGVLAISALLLVIAAGTGVTTDLRLLVMLYIGAGALSWALSLGSVLLLNRRDVGAKAVKTHKAGSQTRSRLEFTMIDITNFLISSGSFIVGAMVLMDRDLGLLRGAERVTLLVAFVIGVTNAIVAPRIARSFAAGDTAALVAAGRWAVRWNALLAAPVFLFCIAMPDLFIELLGPDFAGIAPLIRIMAVGQLINVLSGPCAMYLAMTEHAGMAVKINAASLVVSVALYLVLSSLFGATGFALAYTLSIVFRNVAMLLAVRHRLRIWYLPRFGF